MLRKRPALGIELKQKRVICHSEDLRVDCITKKNDNQLILLHLLSYLCLFTTHTHTPFQDALQINTL